MDFWGKKSLGEFFGGGGGARTPLPLPPPSSRSPSSTTRQLLGWSWEKRGGTPPSLPYPSPPQAPPGSFWEDFGGKKSGGGYLWRTFGGGAGTGSPPFFLLQHPLAAFWKIFWKINLRWKLFWGGGPSPRSPPPSSPHPSSTPWQLLGRFLGKTFAKKFVWGDTKNLWSVKIMPCINHCWYDVHVAIYRMEIKNQLC